MPTVRSQYYPHNISIRSYGKLTDADLLGFTKTLKAIHKLFKGGHIDVFVISDGIITECNGTKTTIKQYTKGTMPGGFKDRKDKK